VLSRFQELYRMSTADGGNTSNEKFDQARFLERFDKELAAIEDVVEAPATEVASASASSSASAGVFA